MTKSLDIPRSEAVYDASSTGALSDELAVLRVGNREVITDHYFHLGVIDEPELYQNKVYIRLGAKKNTVFRKVSFKHCVFESCYLANCTFDSCDFTGCRFISSNLHQTAFTGCKFWYATFQHTQVDDDILTGEAPVEENLRMRFARTLRVNFTQLGDAKAVNRAISLELQATEQYLRKSWSPNRSNYYRNKYPGWKQAWQFGRWLDFKLLDILWGNGESIVKLIRSILFLLATITVYDVTSGGNAFDVTAYLKSATLAPGVLLGVLPADYPPMILSLIAASRYVGFALLTALLVKRFGRR